MSKFRVRLIYQFYNFSGLFNFKLQDGKNQVSNITALTNLVKVPIILLLQVLVFHHPIFHAEVHSPEALSLIFSKVVQAVFIIQKLSASISSILFCWIQVANRHKLKRLINGMMLLKIANEPQSDCMKSCIRDNILIFSIFTAKTFGLYFVIFKFSMLSFIVNIISSFLIFQTFVFVSFVKNFENYVLVLMEEFRKDLKHFSFRRHQKYFERYDEIHDLIRDFQQCFGLQLSVFTCFFLEECIFGVSDL